MNTVAWIWLVVVSLMVVFLIWKDVMHTTVIEYLVNKVEHLASGLSKNSRLVDQNLEKAMKEIEDNIKSSDTPATVKEKAEKTLKKYGVEASVKVAKRGGKKPAAKKSTKKGTK